jgi:protease-4
MKKVRSLAVLSLCCLLPVGCSCLPPLKTESEARIALTTPVNAKVDATLNTVPDTGPMHEVPLSAACPHAGEPKVAVVDVDGLLLNADTTGPYSMGDNPVSAFYEKMQLAAADPDVKAVVLRINSPGGGAGATQTMSRTLADFRGQCGKPVVACLLDMGAGGAYYLASGCDQIFAMPSSVVGGIGVILNLYYLELAMDYWNSFGRPVKSGDRIDMGTPIRKMTPEEKTMLEAMAQEYHSNFKKAVLAGRPGIKADAAIFDGRVVAPSKALEEGLIDAVGYLPDAIARAGELAKVQHAVTVVMYRRPNSPARSPYETVPNRPQEGGSAFKWSIPGQDRSKLPLFLYMWQADPTLVQTTQP